MARIVNVTETATAAGASYSVTLGAHQTNDLLLVKVTNDGGGTSITTASSGWSMVGTNAQSQAQRSAWAYKVAASSAESNPSFSGANDDWIGTCLVIRGADTSTPIEAWQRSDWGNSASINTAASNTIAASSAGGTTVITGSANCLFIYSWSSDGNPMLRCKSDDLIAADRYQGTAVCHVIGHRNNGGSSANPTDVTMYANTATEGGNGWVFAIKNASGGDLNIDVRSGIDEWNWHGDFGNQHGAFGTSFAPSTLDDDQASPPAAVTIGGIDGSTVAGTITQSSIGVVLQSSWGSGTTIASTENTGSSPGLFVGAVRAVTSKNMSGKFYYLHLILVGSAGRHGNGGVVVAFADSSGNWAAYQLFNKLAWAKAAERVGVIALGSATAYGSSGTIDWTDIVKVGYFFHRTAADTTISSICIKNEFLLSESVITGGGSGYPANPYNAIKALTSWDLYKIGDVQASAQTVFKSNVSIGDGAKVTYWDSSASSIEYPLDYSVLDGNSQQEWNVDTSVVSLAVNASASDTINLTAGVAATDTNQNFTIKSGSSTSATYDFGQSFVGFTPTLKTGVPVSRASFVNCYEIDAKGATLTNCSISDTRSTDAAIAFSESAGTLSSTTIDVTGTSAAYHLELGTAVDSITLTDVTFTGTPGTDKVHVRKTTGTVTISISGTTTLAAGDVTTEGATVSIVSDPVYQVVVVSGFTSGSRIQIYDTTNAVELFNGTASAGNTVVSGTTATWTDPTAAAGDRAIRVRVAYVSGATAKGFLELTGLTAGTTSGTASVTYPVTQVNDTVYNNNAITGSGVTGVTFTDSSPDVVNIDVAANTISWKSIYAAWVYYAFTSTGIATDIDYIEGVDEANYILSNMKVKNTSSPTAPLEVTGGYGRDATTGAAIDLVDTSGGTLVFAPDHVVSYAVGSGVTSQDKVDIATEVLSQASSAPIYADMRKTNGTTLQGDGTESNKFRSSLVS